MSNGRTFDPEIADVLLQAACDGRYSYRDMVDIVHEQAPRRYAEVLEEGGTKAEAEAERRRWSGFGISSITAWKVRNPAFEAELMEAGNQGAVVEAHAKILPLVDELREVAFNVELTPIERSVRTRALGHMINAHKHLATIRLERRRTYHVTESPSVGSRPDFPALPRNRRFENLGGRGDDVN